MLKIESVLLCKYMYGSSGRINEWGFRPPLDYHGPGEPPEKMNEMTLPSRHIARIQAMSV